MSCFESTYNYLERVKHIVEFCVLGTPRRDCIYFYHNSGMLSVVFRPTARCSARLYQSVLAKSFSEAVAVQTESSSSIEGNKPTRHTLEEAVISALTVHKAVTKVKNVAWANFDETVDIAINTSLDPRKPNQSVKGIASLPYGTGKAVRVCVFAVGAAASEAKEAGAEVVGSENLVAQIQAGNLNFDTVIATPDMMAVVGKLGRVRTIFFICYMFDCILTM